MANAMKMVLFELGEDIDREGLQDTPARVAKLLLEMTRGLREPAPRITVFDKKQSDNMVTMLNIEFYSLCEHHMAPFYGRVHIGYLPGESIVGLSKFARIVDWVAARPQTQEYMTSAIADHFHRTVNPRAVMVESEGTHLCMSMRGVKKPNAVTITTAIRGDIDKAEFYHHVARAKR